MDEHEIEHLVSEEQSSHIPPVTPEHLDTKVIFSYNLIPLVCIMDGFYRGLMTFQMGMSMV